MYSLLTKRNQDGVRKDEIPLDQQITNPFLYEKAQRKRFDYNYHMNSEEFKDLGTLH
jgi:hypothetical protein